MIPRTDPTLQTLSWQQQLADGFAHPDELLKYLGIDSRQLQANSGAHAEFRLRLPRWFADRMERGNPADPLLRQFLPIEDELQEYAGFVADPVRDLAQSPLPGLIQKYRGRALLIATGACAVNCRYCFRRHYPYQEKQLGGDNWDRARTYLAAHSGIHEVILSGGDPLMLSDDRLARLVTALADIPHVRRLRLHTRLPVVLPSRITSRLISIMDSCRLDVTWVLHANHPRELSSDLKVVLQRVRDARITLLNQSVLLKGVNDCADTLTVLSEKLFSMGVLPYYLHQLDRVSGAAHFEVSHARALELKQELRGRLPGYLVPRLVREVAGREAKIELSDEACKDL